MSEFKLGDKVILPPANKVGTVKAWRYESFGPRWRTHSEQVVDVRFHDGSFTTMRAAHFKPVPATQEGEGGLHTFEIGRAVTQEPGE